MRAIPTLVDGYLGVKSRFVGGRARQVAAEIGRFREDYRGQPDEVLRRNLEEVRQLARRLGATPPVETQFMALVAELAHRTLGLDPRPVQLAGALLLRRGKIVQMNTGEGKTLLPPFHAAIEASLGRQILVLTANEYLANRDARWMAPLYEALGLSVGSIQDGMPRDWRQRVYGADVVYADAATWVFDNLRSQNALTPQGALPLRTDVVVIDEVDAILLDRALGYFELVQPIKFEPELFAWAERKAPALSEPRHFTLDLAGRDLTFTDEGYTHIGDLVAGSGLAFELVLFHIRSALEARHLYRRDHEYLLEGNRVVPIDAFTGRAQPGQTFPFALQQAIEEKEGVPLSNPNTVRDKITIRSLLSRFTHVSGMSGSAARSRLELRVNYGLEVVSVPPHTPCIRQDLSDLVYLAREEQREAAVKEIAAVVQARRPVLVGTTSIEDAEAIADLCRDKQLEMVLLTAKHHEEEARIIAEAGQPGRVTIAAKMAGRGVDIVLTEEARRAGGLHVVGVARNESRRLDDQLVGRAGRQGDPGSSRFFISLQDDLMRAFSAHRVDGLMKTLGYQPGVPIEHPWINRAVSNAQRRLVIARAGQRYVHLAFDRLLEQVRLVASLRRARVFYASSCAPIAASVLEELARGVAAEAGNPDRVRAALSSFAIRASPALTVSLSTRGADVGAAIAGALSSAYAERRHAVEDRAEARERLILLRSIDYCWSQFLSHVDELFDRVFLTGGLSRLPAAAIELRRQLLTEQDLLNTTITRLSAFYLTHIDDDKTLQEIKYWRGTGSSYGRYGSGAADDLGDGVEEPPDYFGIQRAAGGVEELGPLPEVERAGVLAPSPARTLPEMLAEYLATPRAREGDPARRRAILEGFVPFATALDPRLENATETVTKYVALLESQGLPKTFRREQQQEIMRFLRYLQSAEFGRVAIPVSVLMRARSSVTRTVREIVSPWMALDAVVALLFFGLHRFLAAAHIPFSRVQHLPAPAWLPADAFALVDQAFLGSAWSGAHLGLLGLAPFGAAPLLLRLGKPSWRGFATPLLYLPLLCLGSVAATILLRRAAPAPSPTVLQTAAMLASILGASVLITSVAMLLQKVETVSHPVLFVVFGNTMLAGWRALRAPPFSAREVGALAGCFALLVVLFGVYRRASRVAVPIVTLGRFDFATGKLASRPTVLRLETVVDSGHYIVAFLVVAFTEQWLAHFGTGLLGAMTNVGWPGLWKLGLYLAVAYYLVCSSAIKRLPVSNIKEFLERRSSFVAGAENWQLASRQLRHRIRLTLLANVLMESLIVGLAAGICHRFGLRAGWLFWTTTLALAASFLVRAIVDRSPGTASLGLVLQAPEEEAEDNRSMARRILRLGRGPLAVLVFVVMATTVLYAVLNDPQWLQGALRWLASPPVLVAALLTIGGFLSLLDYVIKGAARLRGGDPRRTKL